MTSASSTPTPVNVDGSPRRSCRHGPANPCRCPRCCRCCTCTGSRPGDFGPALEQFLGTGAGLSASSITRLTTQWQDEARAFAARDLSQADYVYLWVDGIHLKVRLEQEKLCLLVMIGVRADGRKERRPLRRVPGIDRVLGGPAAGLPPAWDAGLGAGGR